MHVSNLIENEQLQNTTLKDLQIFGQSVTKI